MNLHQLRSRRPWPRVGTLMRCTAAVAAVALAGCGGAAPDLVVTGGDQSGDAGNATSKEVSNGPLLEWTEIELDFPHGTALSTTSDGRVVVVGGQIIDDAFVASSHLQVTEDGVDWVRMPLPHDAHLLFSVDMSAGQAVVSGVDLSGPPVEDRETASWIPVYVSADQGETWTEATLDVQAARQDLPNGATAEFSLTSVYVSSDYVVAAVQGHVSLDNGDGAETEPEDPLDQARVFLFGGNGHELAAVASFDGWLSAGSASDDGFRLILSGSEGDSLAVSADGESWSRYPLGRTPTSAWGPVDAFAEDGTVWSARSPMAPDDGTGSSMLRWRVGEPAAQTAHFPSIGFLHGLAVGPAGLVMGGQIAALTPSTADGLPQEQWIGWSVDGYQWGWESARDAFGLDGTEAVTRFAVGKSFVIAMVWLLPSDLYSEGVAAYRAPETRWFIARVDRGR